MGDERRVQRSGNATHTQRAILRRLRELLAADTARRPLLLVSGLQQQLADATGTSVEQLRAEIETLKDRGYVLARGAPGMRIRDSDPILIDRLTPRGTLAAARWPAE